MRAPVRILALTAGALACAVASGLAALIVHQRLLTPDDLAFGMPLRDILFDPYVRRVWSIFVLIGAAAGLRYALPMLWKVKLARALPLVVVTCTVASGLLAVDFPFLVPAGGLLAGLGAMAWARRRTSWRLDDAR